MFDLSARGLIAPKDNSIMQFRKEFIFLIVTNSVMAFVCLVVLGLTFCNRKDACSVFSILLPMVAFIIQAVYYGY